MCVPVRARDDVSKEKMPYNALCADNVGFWWQGLSMFNVMLACFMSLHQWCMGNKLFTLARPTTKWFFHIWMAHSASFCQCICGRPNWYVVCCVVMNLHTPADVSLSNL